MRYRKGCLVEVEQNEQNFGLLLEGILSKKDFEAVKAYRAQGMSWFDALEKVTRTLRKRLERLVERLKTCY